MTDIVLYEGMTGRDKLVIDARAKDSIANSLMQSKQATISTFNGLIIGLAKDMGIKCQPEQYEIVRLFDFTVKYYSDLTLSEIKLAFELSLTGDLNKFLPKDREGEPDKNHYQVFSLEYYSKILNSYMRYRADVKKKMVKKQPHESISEEEKALLNQRVKDSLLEIFNKYRDEGIKGEIMFPMKYLSIIGNIKTINDEPTEEEIKGVINQILSGTLYFEEEKKRFLRNEVKPEDVIKSVYTKASYIKRQQLIYDYFDIVISENKDLKDLL